MARFALGTSQFASRLESSRKVPHVKSRLHLETLEDRTLLSASGWAPKGLADFSSLAVDPNSYEQSSIMVRLRTEANGLNVAHTVAGTELEPDIRLVPGLHKVDLAPGVSVAHALAAYNADPLVLYAEPNYHVYLTDTIPNNPYFNLEWGMRKISAPLAWDTTTGTTLVTVAVLDTGIDYTHPNLFENVWLNQAEIPASRLANLTDVDGEGLIDFYDLNYQDPNTGEYINQGPGKIIGRNGNVIDAVDILAPMIVDADGNDTGLGGWANNSTQDGDTAHPDDFIGWNEYSNSNPVLRNKPTDGFGHGTHVSGTIGAIGNNGVGVAGVNWTVQIMPLKIFGDAGNYSSDAAVIDALSFAVTHGAFVSNNSWGGGGYSQSMKDAIANAGAAGHIFVAAAGNNGSNNDSRPFYPATYGLDNIISVLATDTRDNRAGFSDYGQNTVHLGAPGVNVYSTFPVLGSQLGRNYGYLSGTSMATPHVVGAVALVQGLHPDWTYSQVISAILSTVDPVPQLANLTITGGRLNLAAAVNFGGNSPPGGVPHFPPGSVAAHGVLEPALRQNAAALAPFSTTSPATPSLPTEARSKADPSSVALPLDSVTVTGLFSMSRQDNQELTRSVPGKPAEDWTADWVTTAGPVGSALWDKVFEALPS